MLAGVRQKHDHVGTLGPQLGPKLAECVSGREVDQARGSGLIVSSRSRSPRPTRLMRRPLDVAPCGAAGVADGHLVAQGRVEHVVQEPGDAAADSERTELVHAEVEVVVTHAG